MSWPIAILAIVVLLAIGVGAFAVALARRVVMPRAPRLTAIHDVDVGAGTITLDADRKTTHPGTFGLWAGPTHALVGAVVGHNEADATVTRRLLAVEGDGLTHAGQGRWTGHVLPSSVALDRTTREVQLAVENGVAPAWLIEPAVSSRPGTWAIHIHGVRTTRITALRTVPAADRLGMTSLVVSFRGDTEGPEVLNGASTLGATEWRDVDAAIGYALDRGAERVILFAWSMGASIALLLTERSEHRDEIAGLVLIAPATDWRTIIRHAVRTAKLPGFLATAVTTLLSRRIGSRIVGLPSPIELDALDWTRSPRLRVPTLVIHSDGDTEIPVTLSRRFATVNTGYVRLVEIDGAEHAWEYNLDPERFTRAITDWVR